MFFNFEKSIPEDNISAPVAIYNNIKKNINTYSECKYLFKRWRKYSKQFSKAKYVLKICRNTCTKRHSIFDTVYNHINTYSLEYIMLFSLVTIMYLKNQERKYICYPQPYYEE